MNPELRPLLAPRYWPLWLLFSGLWLITRLPYAWQMALGRGIGRVAYHLAKRRRRIAAINLQLCFPTYSDTAREHLLRQHFASLGMGLLETVNAWWTADHRLQHLGEIEGWGYLATALAQGNGVILLSAHFTSMEIGSRFLTHRTAIQGAYRAHENPFIEFFMKRSRELRAEKAIPREAVRTMVRSLKANKTLWFAVDQNFGHKGSVFADFFGVPAATNTSTARLAQISGAAVIPCFTQRLDRNGRYRVILQPPLQQFPSGDAKQDALRVNQLIEQHIRQAPEQYLWVHRRFKDRPHNETRFY